MGNIILMYLPTPRLLELQHGSLSVKKQKAFQYFLEGLFRFITAIFEPRQYFLALKAYDFSEYLSIN